MQSVGDILGPEGPFSEKLPDFIPRQAQQEMADAVAKALESPTILIAEAGTGTGKTFAYLVPALLSGRKVIISTGTKNLQDQLYAKDLPMVRETLAASVEVALLKGRANYLCQHRLQVALDEGRFASRQQVRELHDIERWAATTTDGDIGRFGLLAEDATIWPQVTSTADNCLGGECGHYDDCFLTKARRRAQEADVVVVNHHLLFADMSLRDDGVGELLPEADAIILDEAHQLPEVASSFFGYSVTANQLLELARDAVAEEMREAGDSREVQRSAQILEKSVRDLRLACGDEGQKGAWSELMARDGFLKASGAVGERLTHLRDTLDPLAERGKGLESCLRRCETLIELWEMLAGERAAEGYIHWFEVHKRSFSFHLTPLEVDQLFREQVEQRHQSWILTSATLAVRSDFSHFLSRLGIEQAETHCWQSPFDFSRQAVLYVPPDLPEPANPRYTEQVLEAALPVIEAAGGRTFLLFTSHRALGIAAEYLVDRLAYPLLVQGEVPRGLLLERFRELGNAVLLGTGSFWEGVDVRGEALSCVMIDKLPFASPGEPVLKARMESMQAKGLSPFFEYQLPQAVIALKQGVGRLIRDTQDYGVLMLCDPRLGSKGYGRVFLDSLPNMSRTQKLEVVQRFFRYAEKQRSGEASSA